VGGAWASTKLHHPFLMAGGAKMAALAGEGKKIIVIAALAFQTGKAAVRVAAIQIAMDALLETGPEESAGLLESFLEDLHEVFQMILDTATIIGSLRIAGSVRGSSRAMIPSLREKRAVYYEGSFSLSRWVRKRVRDSCFRI
jgi:hypothetical protein